MEIKQTTLKKIILSVELNGRAYEMHCSMESPLGELHDVLLSMKGEIVQRINAAQEQEKEVTEFVNNETDVPPGSQPEPEVTEVLPPEVAVVPEIEAPKE